MVFYHNYYGCSALNYTIYIVYLCRETSNDIIMKKNMDIFLMQSYEYRTFKHRHLFHSCQL